MQLEGEQIVDLKERIAKAFNNRKLDIIEPGKNSTNGQLEDARRQRAYFDDPDNNPVPHSGEYVEELHNVSVDNPEHYPLLLKLVSDFLIENQCAPLSPQEITNIITHEFQHASVISNQSNFKVRYGIGFFQSNMGILYAPFINIEGAVSSEQYKAILSAPSTKSDSDTLQNI